MSRIGKCLWAAIAGLGAAAYGHQASAVDELATEVAALRRAHGEREVQVVTLPRPRPSAGSDAPVPAPTMHRVASPDERDEADGEPVDRAARWNAAVARHHAAIEDHYRAEPLDGAWAIGADRELRARIASALPEAADLRELDCRSSLCRVALHVRAAADAGALTRTLIGDRAAPGWRGPLAMLPPRPTAGGAFDVVVYLGREGTQLPPPP